MLKEERRQYRNSLRKEHEADLMSIQRQPKDTLEDKIAYEQLKALNHYNKPAGDYFKIFIIWHIGPEKLKSPGQKTREMK